MRFMGVEEAFNIPLMNCSEISFQPAPGGSGAMLKALVASPKRTDVCIVLTECIVAFIEKGSHLRILGPVVKSSLEWAICVRPGQKDQDLSEAVWGVSNLGSGSHTMVLALAKQRKWSSPKVSVCGDFVKLRQSLLAGEIDAFLWEKFTTSPYEASGELSIIGGVPTPWGCFCAVVDPTVTDVGAARAKLNTVLSLCSEFEKQPGSAAAKQIVALSGMTTENALLWHSRVRYASPGEEMDVAELQLARDTVRESGMTGEVVTEDVREYIA